MVLPNVKAQHHFSDYFTSNINREGYPKNADQAPEPPAWKQAPSIGIVYVPEAEVKFAFAVPVMATVLAPCTISIVRLLPWMVPVRVAVEPQDTEFWLNVTCPLIWLPLCDKFVVPTMTPLLFELIVKVQGPLIAEELGS